MKRLKASVIGVVLLRKTTYIRILLPQVRGSAKPARQNNRSRPSATPSPARRPPSTPWVPPTPGPSPAIRRLTDGVAGSLVWINFHRHALLDVVRKTGGTFLVNIDDIRPQFSPSTGEYISQTAVQPGARLPCRRLYHVASLSTMAPFAAPPSAAARAPARWFRTAPQAPRAGFPGWLACPPGEGAPARCGEERPTAGSPPEEAAERGREDKSTSGLSGGPVFRRQAGCTPAWRMTSGR